MSLKDAIRVAQGMLASKGLALQGNEPEALIILIESAQELVKRQSADMN